MTLADFLHQPLPAWDWRHHDCSRWVDRWVQARGHASPIAALGLVYDSERSAMRRIAEGGGLLGLWTAGMALIGALEPDEPAAGDVGIVRLPTECGADETAAIYTGERWASLTARGMNFSLATAQRIWRV